MRLEHDNARSDTPFNSRVTRPFTIRNRYTGRKGLGTYNTTTCSAAPQQVCSNYHIPMLAIANDVTATSGWQLHSCFFFSFFVFFFFFFFSFFFFSYSFSFFFSFTCFFFFFFSLFFFSFFFYIFSFSFVSLFNLSSPPPPTLFPSLAHFFCFIVFIWKDKGQVKFLLT